MHSIMSLFFSSFLKSETFPLIGWLVEIWGVNESYKVHEENQHRIQRKLLKLMRFIRTLTMVIEEVTLARERRFSVQLRFLKSFRKL